MRFMIWMGWRDPFLQTFRRMNVLNRAECLHLFLSVVEPLLPMNEGGRRYRRIRRRFRLDVRLSLRRNSGNLFGG